MKQIRLFFTLLVFVGVLCSFLTSVNANDEEIPEEVLKMQAEVDEYVFTTNSEDFEKRGIMVTHTGPLGDKVEVGITPFSEENANYLYQLFGKEKIQVVEGIQAVTFNSDFDSGMATSTSNLDEVTETTDETKMSQMTYVYVAIGVVLIAGIIGVRKALTSRG